MKIVLAIMSAVGILVASNAVASSVQFDFSGKPLNASNEMTVSGIRATALAGRYADNPDFELLNPSTWPTNQDEDEITILDCSTTVICRSGVRDTRVGLGVRGVADANGIEGGVVNELLSLRFSESVLFQSATFTRWNPKKDSFDLFVDGLLVAPEERTGEATFDLSGLSGTLISFGADALDDKFQLQSISVAPVPLPASALLLLAGLGGFAFLRRGSAAA